MPSEHERATCARKVRFATAAAADDELVVTRAKLAQGEHWRQECRSYPCLVCFGWHLTSKPRDDTRAMRAVPPLPGWDEEDLGAT